MLKQQFRSLKASEVSELFQGKPATKSDSYFRVLWSKSPREIPQFVVITSTKLHRSAVVRNRVRRVLYDLIRQHFSQWTLGVRVAILVKTPAIRLTKKEFTQAFVRIMKATGLFSASFFYFVFPTFG